jgi:hypothetical protein
LFIPTHKLFVVDVSDACLELGFSTARLRRTRLDVVKYAISIFVHSKSKFPLPHEFGIAVLAKEARIVCPFTKVVRDVLGSLEGIHAEGEASECDFSSIFRELDRRRIMPGKTQGLRVIFVYCRSSVPHLTKTDPSVKKYLSMDGFCVDGIVMVSKGEGDDGRKFHEEIEIARLFDDRSGMWDTIGDKVTSLLSFFTDLLCHPLQRLPPPFPHDLFRSKRFDDTNK